MTQRQRETGETVTRKPTRWRTRILAGQAPRLKALILEQPDRTLRELREAPWTKESMATIRRAIDRVDFTVEKAVQASRPLSSGSARRCAFGRRTVVTSIRSNRALRHSQPSCASPGPAPLMSTEAAGWPVAAARRSRVRWEAAEAGLSISYQSNRACRHYRK